MRRWRRKLGYLKAYFQTLSRANEIERLTDLRRSRLPILLLYGFGATRRSVSILESRLRKDGFDVFSIKLGGLWDLFNTAPIDKVAQTVSEKIESLCQRHGLPRFAVIGYSKGGLIGRYYVSSLGGDKRVHTLITLATPHGGNPWALFSSFCFIGLLSKGVRQMLPRSRFMKEMARRKLPKTVYTVSIFSEKDRTCPPRYSEIPAQNGASVFNVRLPHLHHSDFVIKKSAYETIFKHLQTGLKRFTENAEL